MEQISQFRSVFLVLSNPIDGPFHFLIDRIAEAVFHEESVFPRVAIKAAQNAHGLEILLVEKKLGNKVGFANFEGDSRAAMTRKFGNEFAHHLGSNAGAAPLVVDGEVHDVQFVFMKFVNHEPDYFFALFGNHADAIALAEAAEEILLGPGEFETLRFDLQDFGHIAANHPANVNACLFFFGTTRAHDGLPFARLAHTPPWG